MPISVIDNFQVNKKGPIDTRMVAANSAERLSITYSYDGLKVFQRDNRVTYTWNGSASTWDSDGGLSNLVTGTGNSGFINRWNSSSTIVDSIIYNNQTGTLNGYPVGLLGVNAPPSGTFSAKEAFQVNAAYSDGGEAPPFVISKGSKTTIGENWYYTTGENAFTLSKGSTILQFDGSNLAVKSRTGGNPSTTYNKLKSTSTDLELSTYEGTTPPSGTIMASVVAKSLFYNNNLSAIKFVSDGTWTASVAYPTSIVFYTVSTTTQNRVASIRPNGTMIIGSNTTHSNDKLLIQGSTRSEDLITANAGIKFSSSPSTLNWYEEGSLSASTFVALYAPYSDPVSYYNFGTSGVIDEKIKYVRIGNTVTVSGMMQLDWSFISSSYDSRYVHFKLPFITTGFITATASFGASIVCPEWEKSANGHLRIQNYPHDFYDSFSISWGKVLNPVVLGYNVSGTSGEPLVSDFKALDSSISTIYLSFSYILD